MSTRLEGIVQSEIRSMVAECEKVSGINMAQGLCGTEVPLPVSRGAQNAIDAGINTYTRFEGLQELRTAIARKMRDYNRITADPESDIIVSNGATGAFYCSCLALLNPGDEVIVFEPYYGYHVNTLKAVGAIPVYVRLNQPDWIFSPEDLERAVTPRTKGILVNTPANPSGKVFSRKELQWIAEFAACHDLLVFTDEIYEYFVYEGKKHISPGSLPGMAERTITISGYSKTFCITGWRVGYSVSHNREWSQAIGNINDLIYVCAPAPLQMGVARGLLELGPEYYYDLCTRYEGKRDKICNALLEARLTPRIPQGSYYVLADVSHLPGRSSKEKALYLLSKTGIATVPDEAFFHAPEEPNLVRFCFAKRDEELDEACKRLERFSV